MTFASYLQQHAKACLKLSETVADQHLADRMKAIAADLLKKAREADDGNPERLHSCDALHGVGGIRRPKSNAARLENKMQILCTNALKSIMTKLAPALERESGSTPR